MTVQDFNSLFGKNIRKYRISCGFSQEKLAEMLDVSTNTICQIEAGKQFVRAEKLVSLAVIFKTEVYELFKPENLLPDNSAGILASYDDDLKKAMEKVKKSYMRKLKG